MEYVTDTRYLGVTIDNRLSWKPHITQAFEKCTTLMRRLKTKTLGMYGPKPKLMKWVFNGVVKLKLTYASMTWGHK